MFFELMKVCLFVCLYIKMFLHISWILYNTIKTKILIITMLSIINEQEIDF